LTEKDRAFLQELPVMTLAGIEFLSHIHTGGLIQKDNPFNMISKSTIRGDGVTDGFYLDTENKWFVFDRELPDAKNNSLPTHIVFVQTSEVSDKLIAAERIAAKRDHTSILTKSKGPKL